MGVSYGILRILGASNLHARRFDGPLAGHFGVFWRLHATPANARGNGPAKENATVPVQIHSDDVEGAAPGTLIDAFRRHYAELRVVRIARKRGKSGYIEIGRWFDFIPKSALEDAEGDADIPSGPDPSPEDLARTTFGLAFDHARSHGSEYYRAHLYDEKMEEIDKVAFSVSVGDEEPSAGSGGGQALELDVNGIVKTSVSAVKDHHRMHMETMGKAAEMASQNREMAETIARVEIFKIKHRDREQQRQFEYEMQRESAEADRQKWQAATSGFVELGQHIGKPLGQVLAAKVGQWLDGSDLGSFFAGGDSTESSSPSSSTGGLAEQLRSVLDTLTDDQLDSIVAEAMDERMADLLDAAKRAPNDSEFRNIAAEFRKAAARLGERKGRDVEADLKKAFRRELKPSEVANLIRVIHAGGLL